MRIQAIRAFTIEEILQKRKREIVIQMLSVYGDETSDGKQKRIFAVVGIVGTQEKWNACEILWNNRTGGIPYHATDCLGRYGDYEGWSKEKSFSLHNDLAKILVDCGLVGNGFSIDLLSFAEIFPNIKRYEPFLYCFTHMVAGVVAIANNYNKLKTEQYKENAKFVFHERQNQYNVGRLYNIMQKFGYWDDYTSCMEPSIEFAFSEKYIGLQAADLWALEVRKEFDNRLNSITITSDASILLSPVNGFVQTNYFKSNILDFKKIIEEMKNGPTDLNYQEWLSKHRRNNNEESQIEFIAYWDKHQSNNISS